MSVALALTAEYHISPAIAVLELDALACLGSLFTT